MSLPSPIITILAHFQPLFTAPTWQKAVTSLIGTLLARSKHPKNSVMRYEQQMK